MKERREELKRQELDRAQKVAQDSRERQRILAELEAKAKMESYIPPGGIVVKGPVDFKNTHFHNPVIVKHDMETKTAVDKAQEERAKLQELLAEEARVKLDMQERAKNRGQQALNTQIVEQQMGHFLTEIEKFRKADGYDKIQKGKQGAPTQNRCYIKETSSTQDKQKKLEQIFEKMFSVEAPKPVAKEHPIEAPKTVIKLPEPQLPLHIKEKLDEDPFKSVRKNLKSPYITHKAPIHRNRAEIPTPQSSQYKSSSEESEYHSPSEEEEEEKSEISHEPQEGSLEVSFESELNEEEAMVKKPKYYVNEAPGGSWKNFSAKDMGKKEFEIKPEFKFLPKNITREEKQERLDEKIDKIFGQKEKGNVGRLEIPEVSKEFKNENKWEEFDSFSRYPMRQVSESKPREEPVKTENKGSEQKFELYEPKFEEYKPLVHSKPNILYEDLKTDFISDQPKSDISSAKTVKSGSSKLYEPRIEEYVPSYDVLKPKINEFTPKFEQLPSNYEEDKHSKSELSEDFLSLMYSDSKRPYDKEEKVDINLQFLKRKPEPDNKFKDFLKFDKDSFVSEQRSAISSSKKDSEMGVSDLLSSKEHSGQDMAGPRPEKRKAWAVDISDLKEMREKNTVKYETYEKPVEKYQETLPEYNPKDDEDWFAKFKQQEASQYERKPVEKFDWMNEYKFSSDIPDEVREPPKPQERKPSWTMEFDVGAKTVKQDSESFEQASSTLRSNRAKAWSMDLEESPQEVLKEKLEEKPKAWAMDYREESYKKPREEDMKPKAWAMEFKNESKPVSKNISSDTRPKAWSMDFTEDKPKSVSELFLEKKRQLAERMSAREEEVPKQSFSVSKEKTKEELIRIRKEMLKPKKTRSVSSKSVAFEVPTENSKKDPNSDLLSRLATGGKPKVSQKEAKELALKNYKQLPEVVKRREEEEKKQAMKDRLAKMRNFDKSLQNKRMKQQQRKY